MLATMNDVLLPAKKEGYGVGFFNAINVEMARAVIETAEEMRAPVMIGTASFRPRENVRTLHAGVPSRLYLDHVRLFDEKL